MASFDNLATLIFENRDASEFFDAVVKSSSILNRFTLYDGVKSKKSIPIFEATLVYDDKMCEYDPKSTTDVDEKEFSTSFKRWGFQNCKNKLENTYREVYLKKGQNNDETLDGQFGEWVVDYFIKLNAAELVKMSWLGYDSVAVGAGGSTDGDVDGIRAELVADAALVDVLGSSVGADLTDPDTILAHMKLLYKNMGDDNMNALFGDADREYKPVIALPTVGYAAYQLAIASYGQEYEGVEKGLFKTWMGLEVVHYSPLATTEMLLTPLSNLVLLTDDYNDADAINTEYDKKTNTDDIWGQYRIGFSYKQPERTILYHTVALS